MTKLLVPGVNLGAEPSNHMNFFRRATAYLSIGKNSLAITDFGKVLELKPDHLPVV